jgi:hypothetical protein
MAFLRAAERCVVVPHAGPCKYKGKQERSCWAVRSTGTDREIWFLGASPFVAGMFAVGVV